MNLKNISILESISEINKEDRIADIAVTPGPSPLAKGYTKKILLNQDSILSPAECMSRGTSFNVNEITKKGSKTSFVQM